MQWMWILGHDFLKGQYDCEEIMTLESFYLVIIQYHYRIIFLRQSHKFLIEIIVSLI